ncbi:MAG TPA: hypothetical protein VIK18_12870 [Pirellulales bacterium]
MDEDGPGRVECLCYAPAGVLPMLLGGAMLLYGIAFASMIDPTITGFEWYRTLLAKLFPAFLVPTAIVCFGATFSSLCVAFAATGRSRVRPTAWRVAVATGIITACIALAWAVVVYAL